MTPKEIIEKLDALHAAGNFHGLTIWPWKGGFQVSLATSAPNSWRIRFKGRPSEGLAAVLGVETGTENDANMPWPLNYGKDPEILTPPDVDEPPLPDEAHEEAGIFD